MLGHQDKFTCCGKKMPQYFWFVVSGIICDTIQAILDYLIHLVYTFQWEKATVCWTLSYTASIIVRHSAHRFIVFGEYEGSYCQSLGRTYLTYSSSIFMSMVTNHFLVEFFGFSHRNAWIITLLWTGIYNYLLLKATWRRPKIESNICAPQIGTLDSSIHEKA